MSGPRNPFARGVPVPGSDPGWVQYNAPGEIAAAAREAFTLDTADDAAATDEAPSVRDAAGHFAACYTFGCTATRCAAPADTAPPTPRLPAFPPVPPEVREQRASGVSAERRDAVRAIAAGRVDDPAVAALEPGRGPAVEPYDVVMPDAKSPAELAGPLALAMMRKLERAAHDYDPRVSFEAARTLMVGAPRVVELATPVAGDADPAARKAALVAALASPDVIALVVAEAGRDDATTALANALRGVGWSPPPNSTCSST